MKTDLIFVLDSSTSIGERNYNDVRSFVSKFARRLNEQNGNRIGVIIFSNQAEVTFNLTQPDKIIHGTIPYRSGQTNTPDALCKLGMLFDRAENNALKIAILFTDGRSTLSENQCDYTSVRSASTALKTQHNDSLVYVIGVTNSVDRDELNEIATSPEFVEYLESFSNLEDTRQEITYDICFSGE